MKRKKKVSPPYDPADDYAAADLCCGASLQLNAVAKALLHAAAWDGDMNAAAVRAQIECLAFDLLEIDEFLKRAWKLEDAERAEHEKAAS